MAAGAPGSSPFVDAPWNLWRKERGMGCNSALDAATEKAPGISGSAIEPTKSKAANVAAAAIVRDVPMSFDAAEEGFSVDVTCPLVVVLFTHTHTHLFAKH